MIFAVAVFVLMATFNFGGVEGFSIVMGDSILPEDGDWVERGEG